MWFQIELPQPVNVAEVLIDVLSGGRGNLGFGIGRGRGGVPSGAVSAYKLQVSMDGTAWSDVAEGQGQSPTTTVTVKPVQAKFVRVTVTTAPPTPLGWAIQRLRIFTVGSVTP